MAINLVTQKKVATAIEEMKATHKERHPIIWGLWVALIAKQHMLLLGPGGTGKSFLIRDLTSRIIGSKYFETAFDETSVPDQAFGPTDIAAMMDGKFRRVTTNMLPEAHIAFLDEFFNANGPLLHSVMPALNERLFHNNGLPSNIPLWSAFMGTNKLNADADQAALWDRVHLRYVVRYVQDRQNVEELMRDSIMRRISSYTQPERTGITLEELQEAHDQALSLVANLSQPVLDTFAGIQEALQKDSIEISTRRKENGMVGVLANAWLKGHGAVTVGDLDILQHMWWTLQDQIPTVRSIVLQATNPGEKEAMDKLETLDEFRAEFKKAQQIEDTGRRKYVACMEVFENAKRLLKEADAIKGKSEGEGASTTRVEELIDSTENLMIEIQKNIVPGITDDQARVMLRAGK